MIRKLITILLILGVFLSLTPYSYASSSASEEDEYTDLIAVPKDDSSIVRNKISRVLTRNYKRLNKKTYLIPKDKNKSTKKQIKELESTGLFEIVEPNYKLDLDSERIYTMIIKEADDNSDESTIPRDEITPNDSSFTSQYYLKQIEATKAWNISKGDNVLVAILDTGIDASHPDLSGKVIGRNEFDLVDDVGHGTEVAGIIAANTNNGKGIAGIGWNTKIISVKITDSYGQASVANVVQGLDDAYTHGAKIVQISLSTSQYSRILENAVKEALERGILIVSTSGNTGREEIRYPSGFEGVIGVGSVSKQNTIERYSTIGTHVSLVAPGTSIFTTAVGGTYKPVTGTSFAAPQISGAAALILSIDSSLSVDDVKNILFNAANDLGDSGKDITFGHGSLNIDKAIELVLSD